MFYPDFSIPNASSWDFLVHCYVVLHQKRETCRETKAESFLKDPEKGEWKEVPDMLARRTYASACELEVQLGCVGRRWVGLLERLKGSRYT